MTTIFHVLDHSLPEQSGYASRSHAILTALAGHGLSIEALTSPKQGTTATAFDDIDGIRYWRTPCPADMPTGGVAGQLRTIRRTKKAVSGHLQSATGIGLLHAHSPCLNGLAVRGLGLPFVYEMRSSWEDAAVSNGTTTEGSLRYRLSRALETYVARRADAVTVICDGLKQELLARAVPEERITVVPNALPESMFTEIDDNEAAAIRQRYGLNDKRVIGFFGSFFDWEGVDALVNAMPAVLAEIPNACLLLAGGGLQETALRERVRKLDLTNHVVFAGRVSPADILACYAVADLMVFPRVAMRLTDMVTPLKPLEAMARSVPVVASDVGGHRELITHGKTGILYKAGDPIALVRSMLDVLTNPALATEIATAGQNWVKSERRWSVVAERYLPVYDALLNGKKR